MHFEFSFSTYFLNFFQTSNCLLRLCTTLLNFLFSVSNYFILSINCECCSSNSSCLFKQLRPSNPGLKALNYFFSWSKLPLMFLLYWLLLMSWSGFLSSDLIMYSQQYILVIKIILFIPSANQGSKYTKYISCMGIKRNQLFSKVKQKLKQRMKVINLLVWQSIQQVRIFYNNKFRPLMIREYDYLFKVVIIGNSSVGKSSLLRRFADDSFQESYLATIGVDFRFKSITVNGDIVKLQIWDTAGQERFRTITGAYYKGAHAIMIVYDITREDSFKDIQQFWLGEIQKHALPNVQLFVLGNKSDSPQESRKVKTEDAQQFCKSRNLVFSEVSAKSGDHVTQVFHKVAEALTKIYPKQQRKNTRNPVIDDIAKKKKQFQLQSASQANKKTGPNCC